MRRFEGSSDTTSSAKTGGVPEPFISSPTSSVVLCSSTCEATISLFNTLPKRANFLNSPTFRDKNAVMAAVSASLSFVCPRILCSNSVRKFVGSGRWSTPRPLTKVSVLLTSIKLSVSSTISSLITASSTSSKVMTPVTTRRLPVNECAVV